MRRNESAGMRRWRPLTASTLGVGWGKKERAVADGEIERALGINVSEGDEVAVVRPGGVLVLDGPQEVIDRLIAGDPALGAARPVRPSSAAANGALAALEQLVELVGERAAASKGSVQTVFQLDPVGQAMFDLGGLTATRDGFFRLFGQAADGKFSGHGALEPVSMAPQQLVSAQLAMVTVALTAAIKEVQEAVERVEDKVDLLRDILDAERDGEIIGSNRALRRRAENLGFDSTMSDTDWHAIDGIGVAVEQQIERLRSFIRKRVAAAEDEGRRIAGRLDAVEHAHEVAETLALLVVAQDSLFLFQQLRVLRIKATQSEFAAAAAEEARALLDEHSTEDADLVQRLRALVEERVEVEALESLRFRTAREIVRIAPQVDETLAWFADQRGLPYESFDIPPLPSAAEVADEVRERGATLASGGKRAIGDLTGRVRARKGVRAEIAESLALETDADTAALPPGEEAHADSDGSAGRFSTTRSSAMARLRRGSRGDASNEGEAESGRDPETLDED
jgi:hypothetical protein